MKRVLFVVCVVAFLAALPASHFALANGPAAKVFICHVNSANGVGIDPASGDPVFFGRVIEVSENAIAAHLAQHGDSTEFVTFDKADYDWIEAAYQVQLKNANCLFGAGGGPE
jgi:hypothetical protein